MSTMMPDWALSGRCFAVGTLSYILRITSDIISYLNILSDPFFNTLTSAVIVQFLVLIIVKGSVLPRRFEVAWRALLLGCTLNMGMTLATYTSNFQTLGIYCIVLAIFHWSEYMMQSMFNPVSTQVDSYLLYHSHAYVIAFFTALVEYSVEYYMWPGIKMPNIISNIGISLVIFGEGLRKASMWTAKSNFNHYVQYDKDEEHELVTHGVYGLFRHPSYVGWFLWSLGTQLILFNPLCMIVYAAASWKFFNERIYAEEITLIRFFGDKYIEYQGRVGTGLPFITGFTMSTISTASEADDPVAAGKEQ